MVEPVNGGAVGFSESLGNPYDDFRVEFCRISQDLTDVDVIGLLQLIFDQNKLICIDNLANDVSGKVVYRVFCANEFEARKLKAL